jgi:DNA-binding transcriptional LysR family regulator
MELKYFATFKTILETGSFQKAAEKLNYSKSTITFQMQQFEQELSVKLFEKIGRKMIVTQAGKELLPHIDTVIDTISIIEGYGKRTNELSGELSISMPESLLNYKIQRSLSLFREQAPNVCLSFQTQNCLAIREQILNGTIDFGVHYEVGGYDSNIYKENLAEFELALICCPGIKEQDKDFITLHQRKSLCLLTDDRNSIFFSMFSQYLLEQDIVIHNVVELNSIEAIKRSVASNLGVAILPRFTVEQELKVGTLNELDTKMKNKKVIAIFAHHNNKWISPAMSLFMQLVRENFNID